MDNKKVNTLLLLLGAMGFLTNGDIYSSTPLLVKIAAGFNITVSTAALSVTVYMLAFALFTMILGPVGDRFGRTRILVVSSFGTAICNCLILLAPNFTSLIALRIANGAFAAGIMPVSMALIGENFDDSKRQNAIAKFLGMMFLGGASGTAIGGAISYVSSWKTVYFVYGLFELMVAFLLLKSLEKSVGSISKLNYIKIYSQALKNRRLLVVLFIVVLNGLCVLGSFPYSGELIKQLTNYNILAIGLILSVFGIGGIIGGRNVARIREKIGNKICLLAGIIGCVSVFLLTFATNLWLLLVAFCGFGLAFVFLHSVLVETAQSIIPQLRGTIMALVSFSVFFGSGCGTIINKQIMEHSKITNIYLSTSLLFICVGILSLITLNYIQNKIRQPSGPI